ncbi:MAG: 3-deoxy-D-arabinoheptulosonate-7-phosphate synthase [Sphaerisporangium sp.]|jgi:chorismate mutase|nr:3-deoxy-D-arabinoheptulosonate-7-phosphate synthase [Sphaerisporangium sp.]
MSSTGQPGARTVRIGNLSVGDGPVVLLGGAADPGEGGDGRWLSLRGRTGAGAVAEARARWEGPLLVEPGVAGDLPEIAAHADGVVVGAAWTGDLPLVRAAARLGLPLVVQRGHGSTLDEWLDVVDHCAAEGNDGVVLCESGGRTDATHPAVDLELVRAARRRTGRPVLAGAGVDAGLAGAAVAAGADGLWLDPAAGAETVTAAREAVTLVGALVRQEDPGTLAAAREAIDRVDAALAVLLERRASLAGTVQRLKPVGGFAGRDMERERRLVAAMARRAPRLGAVRLAPIMNAVIEGGLHLAEELRSESRENGPEPSPESDRRGPAGAEALAGRGPDHD